MNHATLNIISADRIRSKGYLLAWQSFYADGRLRYESIVSWKVYRTKRAAELARDARIQEQAQ